MESNSDINQQPTSSQQRYYASLFYQQQQQQQLRFQQQQQQQLFQQQSQALQQQHQQPQHQVNSLLSAGNKRSTEQGSEEESEDESEEDEPAVVPKPKRGRKGLDHEVQFSEEETKVLIDLWSNHECLFNSKIAAYSDKNQRDAAMTTIANSMEKTTEQIGKKMISLRSYYSSVRRKYEASRKSGAGTDEVAVPSWPYYESLSFQDDNYKPRQTVSNRWRDDGGKKDVGNLEKSILAYSASIGKALEDRGQRTEDDVFGELVAQKLKKLPESNEKEALKLEIQGLFLRFTNPVS